MEEEKAAAYYDELTRRGEGAARFKQGLGFSAGNSDSGNNPPARGSALPYSSSSSSFLSKFVKASSPKTEPEAQKQGQIESIQSKLKKKKKADRAGEEEEKQPPRVSERDRRSRRRSRSRSRSRDRLSGRRSRSRDRDRDRGRRRRSRSRSRSPRDRKRDRRSRSRSRSPRDRRRDRRSRSRSPRDRRRDRRSRSSSPRRKELEKSKGVNYSKLIPGYDKMSAFERVKAKMNHQLAETAEKDTTKGMGSGWERFEFDKDAPLDDEEIEVAEDDAALVKHIGQTFRFSAFETKREENITAAHDEAMFGRSDNPLTVVTDSDLDTDNPPTVVTDSDVDTENDVKDSKESEPTTTLLSDKVLAKKQGSWRDRIREKKT